MSRSVGSDDSVNRARAAYQRIRAAHLNSVQAALEDHVVRLDWSRAQIERYQDQRLPLGVDRDRCAGGRMRAR
jgi:phenylacetate-CoA ligase